MIDPRTSIGRVSLTIANLGRSVTFYQDVIGFTLHRREDGTAALGVDGHDLLLLTEQAGARKLRGTTGLYHFAILTPSRIALARSLRRLGEMQYPTSGFADHLVSEAIYLDDPDGNGIEIYRDRPRDQWPRGDDGKVQMASDPLDLDSILHELDGQDALWQGLDPATVIGHVHLHVAHIPAAEAFYCDVMGFNRMQHFGNSASFISAGGYHHHLGMNVWAGIGAPPPPPDAIGLRWYEIRLPDAAALAEVITRLKGAGIEIQEVDEGIMLRDPADNGILLTT